MSERPDRDRLVTDTAALNDFNRGVVEEFRANGGRVGGPFEGRPMLLLHTTGAKSGAPRLSPLAYLPLDGKMLIVGSYAGAPKDPAWVHNLRAGGAARVEVGTEEYAVTARELPAERAYRLVEARPLVDAPADPAEARDTHRKLIQLCDRLAEVIEHGGPQLRDLVRSFDDPGRCADAVAAALVMDADARQELIEACDPMVRLQRTLGHVSHMLCELAPCDGAVN